MSEGTVVLQLKPAKRERLADILYGQLLEQMTSGALQEGDRLPSESEICRAFGVSRPVVRQALTRLQADGLVMARQGAGTFVKKSPPAALMRFARADDVASYLRTFEARIGLESESARLAAERRTPPQLAAIRAAMDDLSRTFDAGRSGGGEDFAFHCAVAEASGNELFVELLTHLQPIMLGQMSMALGLTRMGTDERRRQVLMEHERIVEAIAARDGNAASLYMRYHLMQAHARSTDAGRET